MSSELSLKQIKKEWHGTLKAYIIGFAASLGLTSIAFYLAIAKPFASPHLHYALIGLALVQATVQLLFFLHIGQEAKPRWESVVFWFMLLVLLIVVLGSIWIMFDLNYRMMDPQMMTQVRAK